MELAGITLIPAVIFIFSNALSPGINTAIATSLGAKQGVFKSLPITLGAGLGCGTIALFIGLVFSPP